MTALMLAVGLWTMGAAPMPTSPNVVIVYADDLGYGDLGCFGSTTIRTANIDRLAAEGMKFTDFYVAQAVCSASRTALLTGCYPNRLGILGALFPTSKNGIADPELTMGELFKSKGYKTAIFGKWHLGHHPQFLPTRHGFDEYFGLPYSNDMRPTQAKSTYPPLPLIENDKTVETNPDQKYLTRDYTRHAVDFIRRNKDQQFFVYVPHSMPHVPIFASEAFAGKSKAGVYGDVIEEIDWSVGEILKTLSETGNDKNTIVIFTSDNGPWLTFGNHGGTAGPLREGKGTSFEGGVRVPCVMRWPAGIQPGTVCREPVMTLDLLPTFAKLIGAESPKHPIDGKDIASLWTGKPPEKPIHDALAFYWGKELQAVRSGRWKLHFPHPYQALKVAGKDGKSGAYERKEIGLSLFDLQDDIGETKNVADQNPDVLARLQALGQAFREELGDTATKQEGKGVRPPGMVSP